MRSQWRGMEVLHAVATALQRPASVAELAQGVVEAIDSGGAQQRTAVLIVEPGDERLVPLAVSRSGRNDAAIEADKRQLAESDLRIGRGVTGWVAQTGESACISDVRRDRRYVAIWPKSRSELCVPLRFRSRVIGVVNVEAEDADRYQHADQRLLEIVAAHTASVIDNARLRDPIVETLRLDVDDGRLHTTQRELHHILTAINLSSEILLKNTDPHDIYFGEVHSIKRAAERAAELSRQLLAFRRS